MNVRLKAKDVALLVELYDVAGNDKCAYEFAPNEGEGEAFKRLRAVGMIERHPNARSLIFRLTQEGANAASSEWMIGMEEVYENLKPWAQRLHNFIGDSQSAHVEQKDIAFLRFLAGRQKERP